MQYCKKSTVKFSFAMPSFVCFFVCVPDDPMKLEATRVRKCTNRGKGNGAAGKGNSAAGRGNGGAGKGNGAAGKGNSAAGRGSGNNKQIKVKPGDSKKKESAPSKSVSPCILVAE